MLFIGMTSQDSLDAVDVVATLYGSSSFLVADVGASASYNTMLTIDHLYSSFKI